MVQVIKCLFGQHAVDRRRVWNDSVSMRGACRGCSMPLIRDLNGWRPFDPSDHSDKRLPHPHVDLAPRTTA